LGADWENDGSPTDEAFEAFATEAWSVFSDPDLDPEAKADKIRELALQFAGEADDGDERESFREAAGRLQGFGPGWCAGGRRRRSPSKVNESRNRLIGQPTQPRPRVSGTEADVLEGRRRRYPSHPAPVTPDSAKDFVARVMSARPM
jgi:hypothetical protein